MAFAVDVDNKVTVRTNVIERIRLIRYTIIAKFRYFSKID